MFKNLLISYKEDIGLYLTAQRFSRTETFTHEIWF